MAPLALLAVFLGLAAIFLTPGQNRPFADAHALADAFVTEVDKCRVAIEAGRLPDLAGDGTATDKEHPVLNGRYTRQLSREGGGLLCWLTISDPASVLSDLEMRSLAYEAMMFRDARRRNASHGLPSVDAMSPPDRWIWGQNARCEPQWLPRDDLFADIRGCKIHHRHSVRDRRRRLRATIIVEHPAPLTYTRACQQGVQHRRAYEIEQGRHHRPSLL